MKLSYDICSKRSRCSYVFGVVDDDDLQATAQLYLSFQNNEGYRRSLFDQLLHRLVRERHVSEMVMEEICNCSAQHPHNQTCGALLSLWGSVMESADFCQENEYFDLQIGCVCRNGKQCDETSGDDIIFRPTYIGITVAVIFGLVIYWFYNTNRTLRYTHKLARMRK